MAKNIQGLTLQAMRRRTKLSFGGRGAYAVESLESGQFSMQEIRQEYSRLRDIMRKRLTRLESSETWAHTDLESTPVSLRMENYPTLREMRSERDLVEKLRDLAQAVESPLSTITGLQEVRARSLRTLYEHYEGEEFEVGGQILRIKDIVNEDTYREFGQFLSYVRSVVGARAYYYDEETLALFGEHVRTGSTMEDLHKAFDEFIEGKNKQISQIPEVKR